MKRNRSNDIYCYLRMFAALAFLVFAGGCSESNGNLASGGVPKRFWPDNLYGVCFTDDKTGWVSGYGGGILKTEDGGETWEQYYIGSDELIRRLIFVDSSNGWAVGHKGSIFNSADGGVTWTLQYRVNNVYIRDIDFIDRYNGWAVGHEGLILHTSDGGLNWDVQNISGYKARDLPRLHGIVAIDKQSALAVGEFGVIAETVNASDWSLITSNTKTTMMSAAVDGKAAYVVGMDGEILRIDRDVDSSTYNQVTKITVDSKSQFYDVVIDNQNRAIAVGNSKVIAIDNSGAHELSAIDKDSSFLWLSGVDVDNTGSLWAVGSHGTVLHSSNSDLNDLTSALQLGISNRVVRKSSMWKSAL